MQALLEKSRDHTLYRCVNTHFRQDLTAAGMKRYFEGLAVVAYLSAVKVAVYRAVSVLEYRDYFVNVVRRIERFVEAREDLELRPARGRRKLLFSSQELSSGTQLVHLKIYKKLAVLLIVYYFKYPAIRNGLRKREPIEKLA